MKETTGLDRDLHVCVCVCVCVRVLACQRSVDAQACCCCGEIEGRSCKDLDETFMKQFPTATVVVTCATFESPPVAT